LKRHGRELSRRHPSEKHQRNKCACERKADEQRVSGKAVAPAWTPQKERSGYTRYGKRKPKRAKQRKDGRGQRERKISLLWPRVLEPCEPETQNPRSEKEHAEALTCAESLSEARLAKSEEKKDNAPWTRQLLLGECAPEKEQESRDGQ
jgi:hypothetical protein